MRICWAFRNLFHKPTLESKTHFLRLINDYLIFWTVIILQNSALKDEKE